MREHLDFPTGRDALLFRYQVRPSHRLHHHEELEFNLALHGSCTYLVGERRYDLRRGSLIWLYPDQPHVLLNPSPDCELWVVVVRQEALKCMVRVGLDKRLLERSPVWRILRILPSGVVEQLDRLCQPLIDAAPALANVGIVHATLMAWTAFQAADEGDSVSIDPAIDLAARLLSRDDAPTHLPLLARRVGLSPAHLSRRFHQQLGVHIVDYRNRIRLERFLSHYREGSSLLEAALEAGFGSYPQFHRVFTQHLGVGPRDYLAGRTAPREVLVPRRSKAR